MKKKTEQIRCLTNPIHSAILFANEADIKAAEGKIPKVMLDRLMLDNSRIEGMAKGIEEVALLPDPVGHILDTYTTQDSLQIQKVISSWSIGDSLARNLSM